MGSQTQEKNWMQISGSLENIGEYYKMAALGTNPTEVAFCLLCTVKKKLFSLFYNLVRGETTTEQKGYKSCNYQMQRVDIV